MKNKLVLMALASAAIVSCSNHDDWFDAEKEAAAKHAAKVEQYTAAFIKEFGTPAPGHTWGFGATRAVTRASDHNKNQWAKTYIVPADVTKEEEAAVLEAFTGVQKSNVENVNWTDFFVQQVHKGTNTYKAIITDKINHNVQEQNEGVCSNQMDYLMCGTANMSDEELKSDANHIANFNNGNCTDGANVSYDMQPDGINTLTTNYNYGIMLQLNSSTGTFAYHCSTSNKVVRRYIILQVNGAYYVGFNFKTIKDEPNQTYEYVRTDEYDDYTDWIVKISPAKLRGASEDPEPTSEDLFQIWCEDLGGEYATGNDFDFNDIVLNFKKNSAGNTEIWLEAAGGTMEANISWDGESLGEVHNKLGVSTTTMVNTGVASANPVLLTTVNGIVTTSDAATKLNIKVKGKDGVEYSLANNESTAPQMIVCEGGLAWSNERVSIKKTYPGTFESWVQNNTGAKFGNKQ